MASCLGHEGVKPLMAAELAPFPIYFKLMRLLCLLLSLSLASAFVPPWQGRSLAEFMSLFDWKQLAEEWKAMHYMEATDSVRIASALESSPSYGSEQDLAAAWVGLHGSSNDTEPTTPVAISGVSTHSSSPESFTTDLLTSLTPNQPAATPPLVASPSYHDIAAEWATRNADHKQIPQTTAVATVSPPAMSTSSVTSSSSVTMVDPSIYERLAEEWAAINTSKDDASSTAAFASGSHYSASFTPSIPATASPLAPTATPPPSLTTLLRPISIRLFKSLLRAVRPFDTDPNQYCLLHKSESKDNDEPKDAVGVYLTSLLDEAIGGERIVNTPATFEAGRLHRMLRREFQRMHEDPATALLAALEVLRILTRKQRWSDKLSEAATAMSRAAAAPVTPGSTPSMGSFLVAHPLVCGPYARCVVLLLTARTGLVINRTEDDKRSLLHTMTAVSDEDPIKLALGHELIRWGGQVEPKSMTVLSKSRATKGENLPDQQTNHGGLVSLASHKILHGFLSLDDVTVFVGRVEWESGQLEKELEEGLWIPCEGSSLIAFMGKTPRTAANSVSGNLWLSMATAVGAGDIAHWMWNERATNPDSLPCDEFF